MFRSRFFGARYFAARFFSGDTAIAPPSDVPAAGGNPMIAAVGVLMNR